MKEQLASDENAVGRKMTLEIPPVWLDWILGLFMKGCPVDQIVAKCVKKGLNPTLVQQTISDLQANPLFEYVIQTLEKKAKTESLLNLLSRLCAHREPIGEIQKVATVSKEVFFSQYFFSNRPLIVTDAIRDVMRSNWNPEWLAEMYGERRIEVSSGLRWTNKPPYKSKFDRTIMPFGEFVAKIQLPADSDSLYLTSENALLANSEFQSLLEVAVFECPFLNTDAASPDTIKIWMGPGGTLTPLHHDRTNILFAQVFGRKKFILCPATDLARVHNDYGCYSPYSFTDKSRPMPKGLVRYECEVGEGEALFLPAGWWHEVVSLDTSVSLTYHNFDCDIAASSWGGVYWIRNCPRLVAER